MRGYEDWQGDERLFMGQDDPTEGQPEDLGSPYAPTLLLAFLKAASALTRWVVIQIG